MPFLSFCFAFFWLKVKLYYFLTIKVRVSSKVDLRCEIDLVDMCARILSLTLYGGKKREMSRGTIVQWCGGKTTCTFSSRQSYQQSRGDGWGTADDRKLLVDSLAPIYMQFFFRSFWNIKTVLGFTSFLPQYMNEFINSFDLKNLAFLGVTVPVEKLFITDSFVGYFELTFWRRNYFFYFSTSCIWNVNNTGTKYVRIMKQTAFWREKTKSIYLSVWIRKTN